MRPEKNESSPPRPHSSPRPPRVTTDAGVAPPPPTLPKAGAGTPPPPAVSKSAGSIPPPPPSKRPVRERPTTGSFGKLPPPVSAKPALPKAPPAVSKVGGQYNTDEQKRLEEENYSLRKRLSAQREETRVEQKNVERLRKELAEFRAKKEKPKPASVSERSPIDKLRSEHLEEIRELKAKHQKEIGALKSEHLKEINQLKSAHAIEMRNRDRAAEEHEKQSLSGASTNVQELEAQIADLKEKNTAFRQKNTDLREKNGALENQLRELRSAKPALPSEVSTTQNRPTNLAALDDLTALKGVGPAKAKALHANGVTTFAQIAAWTEADINEVASKIKTAAATIKKNDWVGEAKKRV